MNTKESVQARIEASKKDIAYCENEIASLAANAIEYPVNAGYAAKETVKLENIIRSHKSRLAAAQAELAEIEAAEAVEVEAAPEFKGKKFYTCRRCSGTGNHCNYGVCYGCNGTGKKKTKSYKIFLGEPTDIHDPRLVF